MGSLQIIIYLLVVLIFFIAIITLYFIIKKRQSKELSERRLKAGPFEIWEKFSQVQATGKLASFRLGWSLSLAVFEVAEPLYIDLSKFWIEEAAKEARGFGLDKHAAALEAFAESLPPPGTITPSRQLELNSQLERIISDITEYLREKQKPTQQ